MKELKNMSDLNLSVPVELYDFEFKSTLGIFFDYEHIITDAGAVSPDKFIGWRSCSLLGAKDV